MDKEYIVLRHIHEHGVTTQRDIAADAGISVGAVNMLVKIMVKKGFVKMERLSKKTLRYILTPKGMQEKLRLTYNYAKISYKRISLVIEGVKSITQEQSQQIGPIEEVALYGPDDEIGEIIKMALLNIGVAFNPSKDVVSLKKYLEAKDERWPVLVWTPEEQQSAEVWHSNVINVLHRVTY